MQPSIQWNLVADALAPGAEIVAPRLLEGGVSCHIETAELRGSRTLRVVARCARDNAWKDADQDAMAREFELHRVLRRAGLPVPEPLLLDATGGVLGRPGFVMEFVDGTARVDVDAVGPMARFLAELHGLQLRSLALPDLERRDNPLDEIPEYLDDSSPIDGVRWTQPNPEVLLHGDFWPHNVLWADDKIVAVLDWEDAAIGDPMADVAGCRLEVTMAMGSAAADQFLQEYSRLAPFDTRNLPIWETYVASACLHFMGDWGLSQERLEQMRSRATRFLQSALKNLHNRH